MPCLQRKRSVVELVFNMPIWIAIIVFILFIIVEIYMEINK
jgi:hypothetical protein